MLFVQLQGKNPQTGLDVNEFSCALAWLPLLLIENSQQQRHTCASVDKLATETFRGHVNLLEFFQQALDQARALPGNGPREPKEIEP